MSIQTFSSKGWSLSRYLERPKKALTFSLQVQQVCVLDVNAQSPLPHFK